MPRRKALNDRQRHFTTYIKYYVYFKQRRKDAVLTHSPVNNYETLITGHVFVAEFFCLLLTLNPLLISLHPVDHNRDLHSVLFSLV